jgi:hypothetical protein
VVLLERLKIALQIYDRRRHGSNQE